MKYKITKVQIRGKCGLNTSATVMQHSGGRAPNTQLISHNFSQP